MVSVLVGRNSEIAVVEPLLATIAGGAGPPRYQPEWDIGQPGDHSSSRPW
jgi:hypothetical protein